jgi:peroxiredoxin family protein
MFRDKVYWVVAGLLFLTGGLFFRIIPASEFWKADIAGLLGMISSVATAIGVFVAVYFGKKGLDTWRHQNNASINNDLVRRISIALLKYEEALTQMRNPFMFAQEMAPNNGEQDVGTFEERSHRERQRGYTRRLEKASQSRLEVYAVLLESQIFWGDTPVDMFKKVFEFEKEFMNYIRIYFEWTKPGRDDDERKPYRDMLDKKRDIMYDDLSDDGDDFRKELKASVESMKTYLKGKLVYADHHPGVE